MARHVVSTPVSCPQCKKPADCTYVADGLRCSTSWSCPHCGLRQEADGRDLTEEAREAFYAAEGRWCGVVHDFADRQVEVLRVLRTLRTDSPAELMKLLRDAAPVVEGALVEVEQVAALIAETGARLELQHA
jgi:hypothetical protein